MTLHLKIMIYINNCFVKKCKNIYQNKNDFISRLTVKQNMPTHCQKTTRFKSPDQMAVNKR
jgi:hypothetical protein